VEYQNLKDDLLSTIDTGLKFATAVDAKAEFELYLFFRSNASVNIKQGMVESTDGIVEGNAVRVAKQNSVSFASSSGISIDRIKRSVNEAVSSLKSGSFEDSRFRGFCEPKEPGGEGAFASEILELGKDELIEYADDLVKDGQGFDERILVAESSCASEWGGFAVGNTLGLQQASRSASNSCFISCMAADNEERRVAYEYDITRERLINTEGLGEEAARKAINLLGGRKLDKTTILPTVWEPISAAAYILASLARSASGNVVVEGRSPLADKIGKLIANSHLTIVDDGQNPSSIGTAAIDAEGYPQRKNVIIEEGRLSQFMFDSYYARIYGTESTGNCSRGSGFSGSTLPYETSPTISHKSIEVRPGRNDINNLIASIDGQAILISDTPIGIFHSNVSTGEFSAVAQSVFLVQDGEKKCPLQPVSVSGNFYRGFRHLLEVGSDLKKTPFSVETPSLIFDGFSIVG
jgi:PmbA protein